MTYKEVEDQLHAKYPDGLKLDGYNHDPKCPMIHFIGALLNRWFKKLHTFHGDEVHCMKGAYRSLGDFYLVTKYYYPNATLKTVRALLLSHKPVGILCPDIRKVVHTSKRGCRYGWRSLNYEKNEWGWTPNSIILEC